MNQELDDETTQPKESASCKCYVQERHVPCPIHGHDRSQTTERDRKPQRVINTTDTLRRG